MAEYDIQTCSSVWFQTWQVHMECLWPQFLIPKTSQDYSATMCPTLSNSIKFFNELSKLGLKKYGPKPTSAIFLQQFPIWESLNLPSPTGKTWKNWNSNSPTLHLGSPSIDDANDQGELGRHASQKSNGISQRLAVKHQGLASDYLLENHHFYIVLWSINGFLSSGYGLLYHQGLP